MNTYEETPMLSWLQETDTEDENDPKSPLVGKDGVWPQQSSPCYDAITTDSPSENGADVPEKPPEPPRKNFCLVVFGLFEMFAIVTCARLLTMQLGPLLFVPLQEVGILQVALRIDVSLCCVLFMLVELEAPFNFIKTSTLLQNYVSRGFIYSFVGMIGMEESYAVFVSKLQHEKLYQLNEFHVAWETLFIKGASFVMVVMGSMYVVLGAFCMKRLRENLRASYQEDLKEYEQELARYEQKYGKQPDEEETGIKGFISKSKKWGKQKWEQLKTATTHAENGEATEEDRKKWDKTSSENDDALHDTDWHENV